MRKTEDVITWYARTRRVRLTFAGFVWGLGNLTVLHGESTIHGDNTQCYVLWCRCFTNYVFYILLLVSLLLMCHSFCLSTSVYRRIALSAWKTLRFSAFYSIFEVSVHNGGISSEVFVFTLFAQPVTLVIFLYCSLCIFFSLLEIWMIILVP